jgi:RNA polymerase sigma-70 factor (ECF subfamily)
MEAFDGIYRQHVDRVRRYIGGQVPDTALVEDFTSETFLRALRSISKVTYRGVPVHAWLITIAKNIVRDHVQSARQRREVSTWGSLRCVAADQPGPETIAVRSFAAKAVRAHLHTLPPAQRECIRLRFWFGYSIAETARQMRKNPPAIRQLQHRAVRTLSTAVKVDAAL